MAFRTQDVDARQALRRALESLHAGHFDPRHPEGASANALEAIAWSLIGLLGDKIDAEAKPAGGELSSELRARGFLEIDKQA